MATRMKLPRSRILEAAERRVLNARSEAANRCYFSGNSDRVAIRRSLRAARALIEKYLEQLN
jgi:hypothetical protein